MVTKRNGEYYYDDKSSVLAKIQMVTKLCSTANSSILCSVLAKIQMVTKLAVMHFWLSSCSVLAKIQMVTKRATQGNR